MRTPRRRLLSRRSLIGATIAIALVVVSLLTFGATSDRPLAQHDSRGRSIERNATGRSTGPRAIGRSTDRRSTRLTRLSRAKGHPSLVTAAGRAVHHSLSAGSSAARGWAPFSSSAPRLLAAKTQPVMVTTQQPSSGAIGTSYKDTATLSGASSPDGSGSITFTLYPAKGCTGTVLDTETVGNVNANADYTTPAGVVLQNAGTYYWVASFTGDSNNKNVSTGCNDEPVVVAKNSPSILTTPGPSSGAIGANYKDTATLSGAAGLDGNGSITFTLYPAKGCTGTALDSETVNNVNANADYTTPAGVALQNAGTYYWAASFSGDTNNKQVNPSNADCNAEPVVVGKNQPSIVTTQQQASGAIGDTYKDKATLSGGASLDGNGSITFTLYPAKGCTGTVLDTETVTGVSANADYTTPTGAVLQNAGTYYWAASFSGDSNNTKVNPSNADCNAEPVVVGKSSPSIVTTQQQASGAIGDTYKDKATLSGAASLDGNGSITFTLYPAKGCTGTVLDTETVTGVSANADYTTPVGVALQNAGTYYWAASFSG
ncbi:MAG: hypothetical protein ACRDLF_14050, partial [Solirubrobacteraceae bacterium]